MIVKKVRGSALKPRSGEINLSWLQYSFTLVANYVGCYLLLNTS